MLLIGVNRLPYTRRVAITLRAYSIACEQRDLNGFGHREAVRAANPLGRIPALVLDSGETLIDSGAIIDHLDEAYGGDLPLTPRSGADRRAVLKVAAMMMPGAPYLLLGRLTQADITAFVAERLGRGLGIDTDAQMPCLRAMTRALLGQPAFLSTEPADAMRTSR